MPCSPGMKRCRMRRLDAGHDLPCQHLEMVLDYWAERQRQEVEAEEKYRERDGDDEAPVLIDFRAWLLGRAGRRTS